MKDGIGAGFVKEADAIISYHFKSSYFELYRNIGDYIIRGDPSQLEIV